MESRGYIPAPGAAIGKPGTLSFVNPDNRIALFDAHEGNFRTVASGNVHVIDAILNEVSPPEAAFLGSGRGNRPA